MRRGARSAVRAIAFAGILAVAGCESPFGSSAPTREAFVAKAEAECAAKVQPALAAVDIPRPDDAEGLEAARVVVRTARAALLDLAAEVPPAGEGDAFEALWNADIAVLDNRLAALRSQQGADNPGVAFARRNRKDLVTAARNAGGALGVPACLPPAAT